MGELTHYERLTSKIQGRKRVRKLIDELAEDPHNEVWKALPMMLGQTVNQVGEVLRPKWSSPTIVSATHLEIQKWIQDNQEDRFSFSESMVHPDYFGLMQYLVNICGVGETLSTLQVNYQWLSHEYAGKRVYEVTPGLAEQLRYTEVRGVRAEDLRLPYESIYIQIPKEAGLEIWNSQTHWHRVVGAYITQEHNMNEADSYDRGGLVGDIRGWRVLMVGEDKATDPDVPGDDALAFFRILLKEGTTLTDIIAQARSEMDANANAEESTWDHRMSEDWEQQFRWCMNVVLYVTWQEPGEHWISNKEARQLWDRIQKCTSKKKRKALNQKFQTLNPQRRIRLGASIIVDRRKSGKEPTESGIFQNNDRKLLRIKTRVSGHWRPVPYGPKRSLRRYQWIEPYWRNKDGLERTQEPKHEVR